MVLPMVDGMVPILGQDREERPEVIAPNIPNLFFTGDSTGAAGRGGEVAFTSAMDAARAVMAYLEE